MSDLKEAIIIQFDHYDVTAERGDSYYVVYDVSGKSYKVNQKKNKACAIINEAHKNEPLILYRETFTKIEHGKEVTISYFDDAERVADEYRRLAIQKLLNTIHSQQDEARYRSQSVSYAKDLKVAYKEIDLFDMGEKIYGFIKGEHRGTNQGETQDNDENTETENQGD